MRQYNQPASRCVRKKKKEKCRGVCRTLLGWQQHSINRILRRFYILVKAPPPPPFSIDKCTNGISACAIETGPREESLSPLGWWWSNQLFNTDCPNITERERGFDAHTHRRHSMQISSITINARSPALRRNCWLSITLVICAAGMCVIALYLVADPIYYNSISLLLLLLYNWDADAVI